MLFLLTILMPSAYADIEESRAEYKATDPFYREYAASQGWTVQKPEPAPVETQERTVPDYKIPGAGTTYYVATDGDNEDDGSFATPWLTLEHAIGELSTSDDLLVHPGTYTLASKATFGASGVNGDVIRVMNYNGGTVNVDLTGLDSPNCCSNGMITMTNYDYISIVGSPALSMRFWADDGQSSVINIASGENITLDGLYMNGAGHSSIYCAKQWVDGGFNGSRPQYITIQNCETENSNTNAADPSQEAISLLHTDYFVITNNYVHDNPLVWWADWQSPARYIPMLGIDAKVGCTHGTISYNTCHDVSSGIYVDSRSNNPSYINIFNNHTYDNYVHGITINSEDGKPCSDISIYNNLSHGNDSSGIGIVSGASSYENIYIYNNTLIDNEQYGTAGDLYIQEPGGNIDNLIIFNNIIGDGSTNSLIFIAGGYDSNEHHIDYNHFGSAPYLGNNYTTGDPEFDPAGATGYELLGSSKCRDAGICTYQDLTAPTFDYNDAVRPYVGTVSLCDEGAIEWQGSPAGTPPVTADSIVRWDGLNWGSYSSRMGVGTSNYATIDGVSPT